MNNDGNTHEPGPACSLGITCRDSLSSWIYLFIGLLATISVRMVTLVLGFGQFWAKACWYVGVAGFFIYFLHKFQQEQAMRGHIARSGIVERVACKKPLRDSDYATLETILCGFKTSKDRINYFVIFVSSIIVLLLAFYTDFIKK